MKISDLQLDTRNANKGSTRGNEAVAHSLKEFGAGRSILIDKAGRIIAGNKTAANAASAGIEDVIVVQTDGSQIIAVQRVDLDLLADPKAKQLAIADNRTAELGLEWDAAILGDLASEMDLKPFFTEDELRELNVPGYDSPVDPETSEGNYKAQYGVIVICKDEADQQQVYEQLIGQGLECRVVVT